MCLHMVRLDTHTLHDEMKDFEKAFDAKRLDSNMEYLGTMKGMKK